MVGERCAKKKCLVATTGSRRFRLGKILAKNCGLLKVAGEVGPRIVRYVTVRVQSTVTCKGSCFCRLLFEFG